MTNGKIDDYLISQKEGEEGLKLEDLTKTEIQLRKRFLRASSKIVPCLIMEGKIPFSYYLESDDGKVYEVRISEHLCEQQDLK